MLKSYVGIARQGGLESFYPENGHVARFLARLAYRRHGADRVCYWATIQDEPAREVELQLHCGKRGLALMLLQSHAHEIGVILPSDVQAKCRAR